MIYVRFSIHELANLIHHLLPAVEKNPKQIRVEFKKFEIKLKSQMQFVLLLSMLAYIVWILPSKSL